MKLLQALLFLTLALILTNSVRAQEGDLQELDSVIARVNTEVILRSAYDRELKALKDDLQQRNMSVEEIEKKLAEVKPAILDNLIDQQLLTQRAKEINVDVEGQVNEQIVRMMKDNDIKTIEELEQKMRDVGMDLNEQKRLMRNKFLSDAVIGREVYSEVYRSLTERAKKEYYEQHKDWFATPGEVELRMIFVQKGKNPLLYEQFRTKAQEIANQAKGGADFQALVQSKSEDNATVSKKGYVGWLPFTNLSAEVRAAVEKAPVGTVTDPISLAAGYAIYRIEARKEPEVKPYENEEVKGAVSNRLVMEKGQTQVEAYLKNLREDAFIEIDPRYQLPGLKTTSASIKRTEFTGESDKERKKREKREKKEKEQQEKGSAKAKETAKN